jgi:outer membrane protein TolC
MRRAAIAFALALLAPSGAPPAAVAHEGHAGRPAAKGAWTLPALVAEALAKSPAIAAKEAALTAAFPRKKLAGAWPEPMFSSGFKNMGFLPTLGQDAGTELRVGIAQTVPFPGKTDLRSDAAEAGVARVRADLELTRRDVVRRVKEAWFDLYGTQRELQINAETRLLLDRAAEVALARYRLGKVGQMDVLRAEMEAARMADDRAMLEAREQSLHGTLAGLVGLSSPGAHFGPVATPDLQVPDVTADQLAERIKDRSPALTAAAQDIVRAERTAELAKLDVLPDFMLMGLLMNRGAMPGGWEVSASVDLPVFYGQKQAQMVAESAAMAEEARHDREKMATEMVAMAREELAMARSAATREALLRTSLLPRARSALQAGLAGYGAGMENFVSLTMAIMAIQDFQREHATALVAGNKSLARLEALVGELTPGGRK